MKPFRELPDSLKAALVRCAVHAYRYGKLHGIGPPASKRPDDGRDDAESANPNVEVRRRTGAAEREAASR